MEKYLEEYDQEIEETQEHIQRMKKIYTQLHFTVGTKRHPKHDDNEIEETH